MTRGPKHRKRVDSDSLRRSRLRLGAAGRTVLFFLFFGILWIVTTTLAGGRLFQNLEDLAAFELIKGIIFVVLASLIIYFSIALHAERVLASEIESIEKLKQSERTFESLVNGINDHLIVLLSPSGQIRTWNPGAEGITGFRATDVIGSSFDVLFRERDRTDGLPQLLLDSALERGQVTTVGQALRSDGSHYWTESTISAITDEDGNVQCYAAISRDLTETVEYQTRLLRRTRQHAIIARLGEEALGSVPFVETVRRRLPEIGKGLDADCVVLLNNGTDCDDEPIALWRRNREDDESQAELPAAEVRALADTCRDLSAMSISRLDRSPGLRKAGYVSALATRFASTGKSWCLGVFYRSELQFAEDDEHFLSAIARILANGFAREEREQEIKDRDTKLRLVFDQIPAIVWTADEDLIIRSSAGSALREIGVEPNQSVGQHVSQRIPPQAVEKIREALESGSAEYQLEVRGRALRTRVEQLRSPAGSVEGVVGVTIDVTEQETRRRELEASREQLRLERDQLELFMEQAPAIIWSVDENLVFTSTAGSGLAAIASEPDRAVGRHLSEILGEESPTIKAARKAVDEGVTSEVLRQFRGRYLHTHVAPMRDAEGTIVGALGLTLDVTAEQESKEELAEKRAALERLSSQLIRAQEAERERIARELHDEFGGIFTALYFDVASLKENHPQPDIVRRADDMASQIDRAIKQVREIAKELRPKVIDDFGLVPALEDLVSEFSTRCGIDANLSAEPEEGYRRLPGDIIVYRIVQEALTNIARHSGATQAEVRLRIHDDCLTAEIRDNGRGIRDGEMSASGSLGLMGMRERAEILNGSLSIESFEGKGTIIKARIPLKEGACL